MAYISFQPKDYYSTKLYTGNGSTQSITGVGFQPDFTWIKARNQTYNHYVFDAPRGAGEYIKPNQTSAETDGSADHLTAWTSDGFNLGNTAGVNENTSTYASWNWKMGTTSGLSGGTITPSAYSINTTAKQGIYKWAGTGSNGTIAHGLGSTPKMFIVKQLNSTAGWQVYHQGMGPTKVIYLNSTAQPDTSSTVWNDTAPDATTLSLGTNTGTNASGSDYIGYAFCDVAGYSKCGTFVGNNSATDGPFIYTGFRPAYVLVKVYDYTAAWTMFDDRRLGYNPTNEVFSPDTTITSRASWMSDIYSNGFKPFNNDPQINGSGTNYIYLAFSEFPIVSSNDVPGLAR